MNYENIFATGNFQIYGNNLFSCRFLDTVQMLSKEAGPALGQWIMCDNIDLATVLQEYEAYCYVKFRKFPKIAKRRTGNS